ncbi:abortive infection protein [Sphaerisporangium siamense]|uniref:Membrane protease YdiL (CAAX protease family) n=1 Tax=Sphaerisporangium siamense TaxID=795645 RepID=A0A7W7GDV8_9ACTN|nr:CPBP family intramembrane glutamic endopeptidase [Sphaerisporangium siamense]MBB4706042.1 membrane protease YdiL (CAAX protease family) [Sphaerisporangium siamense]GII88603.1 abortive infection protein [Sphaerisporangium siamense]
MSTPESPSGRVVAGVVAPAVGVLVVANVLNNRVARRLAPVTSAVAAGALVALGRRAGLSWPEMGFTTPRRGAVIGGALAAAVAAVYTAGVLTPRTRPLFLDERALGVSRARLLEEALVQVPLGTVLLEEVAFRGVLPAALRRSHGPVAAVAGASALFGLWHILPALDMAATNPSFSRLASGEPQDGPAEGPVRVVAGTVVTTALAGAAFHELRRRGGLAAPSLLHLATNTLGYFAARAARRLERRAGRPGGQHDR